MTQESIQLPTTPPLSGADLVADINKANQALATDFAGDIDPAALAGPYMTWADTGAGRKRIRNAADTEWLDVGPLLGSATLNAFDSLAGAAGKFPVFTGAGAMAVRDIVGTVSQSAGVPTGGLQQVITAPQGQCFRFACGLQIAAIQFVTVSPTPSNVYPAPFTSISYRHADEGSGSWGTAWAVTTPITNLTTMQLQKYTRTGMALDNENTSRTAVGFAVGRWFEPA